MKLALYHTPGCPYCRLVYRAIDQLGLRDSVELRNVYDAEHRSALQAARGALTVPVLFIEQNTGESQFLPESRDIVRYLQQRFGGDGAGNEYLSVGQQ